jgi:Uma2 family endonuclease
MTAFKLSEDQEGGLRGARVPDVSFVSFDRLPPDASLETVLNLAPDIAVEVISESEKYEDVVAKIDDYLEHGTQQVWVVLPQVREVRVFDQENRAGQIFKESDELTGGDLLPGFVVPVRAIFDHGDPALHVEVLRRLMGG